MAIRYSGDAEVRVIWNPRTREYSASVRDLMTPKLSWSGHVPRQGLGLGDTPKAYDKAARRALETAQAHARKKRQHFAVEEGPRGRIVVRRVFQAPCPLE